MTTIVIPVSREDYLTEVFTAIEMLACDPEKVNLLAIVDGDKNLFVKVRNIVEQTKYNERLTLQYKAPIKLSEHNIQGRRLRIADIHNFAKQHVSNSRYIFGIEDDTVVPINALIRLQHHFSQRPYGGIIQGAEMGRHGIPYIGAWKTDDLYEPRKLTSLPKSEGMQEIDAGGFYCFMTKAEDYVNHEFKPYDNNGLGPDVEYSLSLRQEGQQNYVDFSIQCVHKDRRGDLTFSNTTPKVVSMGKINNRWRQVVQ